MRVARASVPEGAAGCAPPQPVPPGRQSHRHGSCGRRAGASPRAVRPVGLRGSRSRSTAHPSPAGAEPRPTPVSWAPSAGAGPGPSRVWWASAPVAVPVSDRVRGVQVQVRGVQAQVRVRAAAPWRRPGAPMWWSSEPVRWRPVAAPVRVVAWEEARERRRRAMPGRQGSGWAPEERGRPSTGACGAPPGRRPRRSPVPPTRRREERRRWLRRHHRLVPAGSPTQQGPLPCRRRHRPTSPPRLGSPPSRAPPHGPRCPRRQHRHLRPCSGRRACRGWTGSRRRSPRAGPRCTQP